MGKIAAGVALGTAAIACTGARTTVVAPDAKVPVSMSRAVRDADGRLVVAARRKVVARFHEERMAWGMFYGAASMTPTTDISAAINAQVGEVGGDAVTELRVVATACALHGLLFPFAVLPVWPGCTTLTIDGDIIKVEALR